LGGAPNYLHRWRIDAIAFGIVDATAHFSPEFTSSLLFRLLVETRGWTTGVATSVAHAHLKSTPLADYHQVPLSV